MELNEKVAIVTGSGRGIGRAIAEELARYGASVVVSDLDGDAVAQVAAEIGADHPDVTVDSAALDVTDDESVANMTDQVIDRFGRVDILVNNAGIIGAPGWEQREEPAETDWDQIYEVNVKGIARASDSVAGAMKTRRYGKIVNIASVAGRQGSPRNTPYHVSKSGVISLTQAYALALAPFNINVNAICPGLLWTPMWERIATRTINLDDQPGRHDTERRLSSSLWPGVYPPGPRADSAGHRPARRVRARVRPRAEHHRPVDKCQRRLQDGLTRTRCADTSDPRPIHIHLRRRLRHVRLSGETAQPPGLARPRLLDSSAQSLDTPPPGLSWEDLDRSAYLETPNGDLHEGFFAIRELLLRLPLTAPIGALMLLPGVSMAGVPAYRWVARNRYRISGCNTPTASKPAQD